MVLPLEDCDLYYTNKHLAGKNNYVTNTTDVQLPLTSTKDAYTYL